MNYLTAALFCFICVAFGQSLTSNDASLSSRIIGGSTASKSSYPYQASIRMPVNQHLCGGAIIGPNWILTSAECVYRKNGSSLFVTVGSYKRESKGVNYNISRIITHNGYNQFNKSNNIALLQTSTVMKFGSYVKKINLAYTALPVNTKCEFTGWGLKRYPSSDLANKLRYIKQNIITDDQCRRSLPQFTISNSTVCAFGKKGQGACTADEGGPLVCKGVLYGILSQYVPCAQGFPDVYTKVLSYKAWIRNYTGIVL